MAQKSDAPHFFSLLFGIFAVFSFAATCFVTPFAGPVVAVISGYGIGIAGRSGHQTASIFVTPLAGVIAGIGLATLFPVILFASLTWKFWLGMVLASVVAYVLGHIGGLLTLRKSRVPGI